MCRRFEPAPDHSTASRVFTDNFRFNVAFFMRRLVTPVNNETRDDAIVKLSTMTTGAWLQAQTIQRCCLPEYSDLAIKLEINDVFKK